MKNYKITHLKGGGLDISMDGRYDSPGFSATNCTVSAVDLSSNLVIMIVNKNKEEKGIGNNNYKFQLLIFFRKCEWENGEGGSERGCEKDSCDAVKGDCLLWCS